MKKNIDDIKKIRFEMITVMIWTASFLFILLLLSADKLFDFKGMSFFIFNFTSAILVTLLISFFHGIWFRNRILSLIRSLKAAEEEISIRENKYKELFNNIDSGVAVYEIVDEGKDLIYKDFNRAAELIVSTKKEEVLGKRFSEIRPNSVKYGLYDVFQEVIKTGKPQKQSATFYEDNNVAGWYENYVYQLPTNEIVSVFRDVTEQKNHEYELLLRDNYLAAFNKLKKHMLIGNHSTVYQDILEILANLTDSERTRIFKNSNNESGELVMTQMAEYRQNDISVQEDNQFPQNIIYAKFDDLQKILSDKNGFVGTVENLTKKIFAVLSSNDLKSFLSVPIIVEDEFWGFMTFENYVSKRKWEKKEIELLNIAANDLSQYISKEKVEKKIIHDHQRFKTILDSINAVVYAVDIKTKELLFINKFAKDDIGVSDDVIGKKCFKVLQKDQYEPCSFCTDKYLLDEDGKPNGVYNWEFQNSISKRWFKCRDVAILWEKDRIARLEVASDITDLKRNVQELRESEKSYKTIFDNAIDAIYVINEKGEFIDVNPGVCKMYGFNKEEILGKTPAFFSAPGKNDLKTISNYLQKAFNGEPQQFEFWGIRKNGEIFPKFIRLSKGYYFGKKVVNAFALDLTEIKEAGYKIKNAKERLSVANSILRHDITNDLTTISSAIKLYQKKSKPEMLDLIKKRVNMSLDVIETHKRQEYFIENNLSLKKVCLLPILKRLKKKYDSAEINISGETQVYADDAIYSIFENLINNAIKHGNASKIDILISEIDDDSIIKVCDNGVGIIDEIKNKVFEKGFFYGGNGHTGIGLHIVKQKVNDYGGSISIQDNSDCQGACFVISLKKGN